MDTPLNPRQKQVLTAIVDHYVVKAEPVSSKVLSANPLLQASSATIRNTMAELEEMGFVEQPHTSAGRTPTDLGYRTYVNDLMQVESLSAEEARAIEAAVSEAHDEQELMSAVARLLGEAALLVHLGGEGGDLRLGEGAYGVPEHLVLFGGPEKVEFGGSGHRVSLPAC